MLFSFFFHYKFFSNIFSCFFHHNFFSYAHTFIRDFFAVCKCLRPYLIEYTSSRSITEVKQSRAWLVLRWVTAWEYQVLQAFYFFSSITKIFSMLFSFFFHYKFFSNIFSCFFHHNFFSYAHTFIRDFFAVCKCLRPYLIEYTSSRSITEVKQSRAWLVLRWVTAWEYQVLQAFYFFSSITKIFSMLFSFFFHYKFFSNIFSCFFHHNFFSYAHTFIRDFFAVCKCLRPYLIEYTSSRSITEVKQSRAWLVLRWVTAWEYQVLQAFYFFSSITKIFSMLFSFFFHYKFFSNIFSCFFHHNFFSYAHTFIRDFFAVCKCLRPYLIEYTSSRSITEVKQSRAWLVLRWVTAWEYQVLQAFYFFSSITKIFSMLFSFFFHYKFFSNIFSCFFHHNFFSYAHTFIRDFFAVCKCLRPYLIEYTSSRSITEVKQSRAWLVLRWVTAWEYQVLQAFYFFSSITKIFSMLFSFFFHYKFFSNIFSCFFHHNFFSYAHTFIRDFFAVCKCLRPYLIEYTSSRSITEVKQSRAWLVLRWVTAWEYQVLQAFYFFSSITKIFSMLFSFFFHYKFFSNIFSCFFHHNFFSYAHTFIRDFFAVCKCLRPYLIEYTSSRSITEVKQSRAWLVLRWVTAWEYQVLQAFYFFSSITKIFSMLFSFFFHYKFFSNIFSCFFHHNFFSYAHTFIRDFFAVCKCLRPYLIEYTSSRSITEVKQSRAWLVLRWVTAWEYQVLQAFYFFLPSQKFFLCFSVFSSITNFFQTFLVVSSITIFFPMHTPL